MASEMTDEARQRAVEFVMDIFGVPDSAISTGEYEREINQVITYGASEYRRGLEAAAEAVQAMMFRNLENGKWSQHVLKGVGEIRTELDRLAQEGA